MRRLIVFSIGLTLAAQNTETVTIAGGFMRGENYLALDPQERAAYAAGFINGMSIAAPVLTTGHSPGEPRWITDCTKEMSQRQIAEIIRKSIQDRPAEWHESLNVLGLNAMLSACKAYYVDPARLQGSGKSEK
jgi:hypothetical protein